MIRDRTIEAREKLLGKLPISGELLRGSLLDALCGIAVAVPNAHAEKATGCLC